MNIALEEGVVEVLDPLDSTVLDVTFTAREVYSVLGALYFDTKNEPTQVLDLIKYLEDRLLDNDMPSSQQEFDSDYIHSHYENEQYKRIVLHTKEK